MWRISKLQGWRGALFEQRVVPPAAASESGKMVVSPRPDERGEWTLEQTYQ